MLEVVIFDLDGLLIDSESLQYRAYREAFARHGVSFELSEWPRWHELEASATRWIETKGLALDGEQIRAEKKLTYDALITEELELKPGAEKLVKALSKDYRLCVASGSRIESIRSCLEKFSLADYFEHLFSATAVKRKKPYPDVYIEAATIMEVPVECAVAIEDSVTGLHAAIAAEIKCIVCPDSFIAKPRSDYDGAALMVESLEELDSSVLRRVVSEC